jgi:plastocyanin
MRARPLLLIAGLIVAAPAVALSQTRALAAAGPDAAPETITIRLSSFKYKPDHLQLRAGVPVRLRFVNDSDGGHDFSAPDLFSTSAYGPGSSPPERGRVDVPGHGTAEISIVPRRPGTYDFHCTHFLHSLFGMTGTVVITPG